MNQPNDLGGSSLTFFSPRRFALIFFALALLHGLVYAFLIPPWQSPDEHGHFEYAWLISQHGPLAGPESISLEFQQRVLRSMAQFDFWRLVKQPMPQAFPTSFTEPSTPLLAQSRPQVGDERPLYYLLAGGLLWLTGTQDVLAGMYIGRIVSVLLYAAAVGLTALAAHRLFPRSLFMQVVPPAFVLFLPMLGEMGAAVNSDALGVLTGTLFFASLVPVFRDGMSWRRAAAAVTALALALLSKKTALFLVPTALLALVVYGWTRGVTLPRRARWALAAGAALLAATGALLALAPSGNAAGWLERTGGCGATRFAGGGFSGEAAVRVGACTDGVVAQPISQEAIGRIAGRQVVLTGWVRGAGGPATAWAAIWDSEGDSQVEIAAIETWQPFTLTHTVDPGARLVAVRLGRGGAGEAVLFDDLVLASPEGGNLLTNGSAEQRESLLLDLVAETARQVGAPLRIVEQLLLPESWGAVAWQGYVKGATFCHHSFWGKFGWLAISLPPDWYQVINVAYLLVFLGNLWALVRGPRRGWAVGYLFVLMGSLLLLLIQTLLPMVAHQGTYWMPQGRYLFPGVFAIAVLIAWGSYRLLPRWSERWAAAAAVGIVLAFDLLCLGGLIVPYFYS